MDISLYDSTGTKKITDTTGLSISITLPLPDSLIKYAGNNKVAAVANGKLESLTPKFTTIDKVSCVTFTAEHFSPYVIYVDTGNLISSGTTDESPKTGDIHPKWFLVFGLTCLAAYLFLKKDKQAKRVIA
jgi:LPXTG-motif cell wall-anchored protein